jgi:hypothetical protein
MMYPLMPLKSVELYLPMAEKEKVSIVARSPGGFLAAYRKYGRDLPQEWEVKRHNFIKRHLAQYRQNPTARRRLALIMWAYMP